MKTLSYEFSKVMASRLEEKDAQVQAMEKLAGEIREERRRMTSRLAGSSTRGRDSPTGPRGKRSRLGRRKSRSPTSRR